MRNAFRLFLMIIGLVFGLLMAVPSVIAQQPDEATEQINAALSDLSTQVGQQVTLDDLARWTFEERQFNTAALGCPQPDQTYAQVITPGYRFTLTYEGQRYDYRVSTDQNTVILCSVEDQSAEDAPDDPQRLIMDGPVVAVSPLVTEPGTVVQVIANGFPPNRVVVVGLGRPESEFDVLRTTRTNNEGVVTPQVTIPDGFSPMDEAVIVIETDDNSIRVTSHPIRIVAEQAAPAPSGNPVVTLSDRSAPVGGVLSLTATGYPPNSDLIIGMRPQVSNNFVYSLRETTNAEGALTTEIVVPETAQVDQPYVVLVEVADNRNYEALSPAFVPTGPAPTQRP
ncbi:MAG: hypothetical protein ACLFTK_12725 [Anaerolineales bacterium]